MTKANLTRLTEEDFDELQKNFRAELYHAKHRDVYYKCKLVKKHTLEAERKMREFLNNRLNQNYYERFMRGGYND